MAEESVVEEVVEEAVETSPVEAPVETPAEEQFQSIRDAAGGLEYDLSSYDDDESALRHLVDRSKEFERQQQTIQHYEQLLQQQASQPAPVPQSTPATEVPAWQWQPPNYSQSWLNQAERDPETGQLRPANGGSPGQVAQLQNFLDYRAGQMDKFWTDGPFSYIDPHLDDRFAKNTETLKEEVQQMIDSALGKQRADTQADQFLQSNPWVYRRDANDQVIRNTITGNQELSEEGKIFADSMQRAEKGGAAPEFQKTYAMEKVEEHRKTTGKTPGDTKKQEFLRAAAGMPPAAGGTLTNQTPDSDGNSPPQNPSLSLEDMLRQNLKAEGVTDADFVEAY